MPPEPVYPSVVFKLVCFVKIITIGFQTEAMMSPRLDIPPENKVICQGQRLKLHCENASVGIKIYSAFYGRTEHGHVICPYIGAENDNTYNCGEDDVTERLKQICEKRNRCRVKVNSALFGDPCPDKHLYLNLVYACEWVKKKHNLEILPSSTITGTFTSGIWVPTPTASLFKFSSVRRFLKLNITSSIATSSHILLSRAAPRAREASSLFATSSTHVLHTNSSDSNTTVDLKLLEKVSSSRNSDDGSLGILGSLLVWLLFMQDHASAYTVVFCVSLAVALGLSFVVGLYIVYGHTGNKQRQHHVQNNEEPNLSANGGTERASEADVDPHVIGPIKTPPPDYMLDEMNWSRASTLPHKNPHEAIILRTYSDRHVFPSDLDSDSYC